MIKNIFFLLFFYVNASSASVIMLGTRVVFSSGVQEKTVQFTNTDPNPYIVEIKLTGEDEHVSTATPFIAVPPVFRIDQHQGQSIRIISTNVTEMLPRDRESVFYMNFIQIPAVKSTDRSQNQLIITVKNRVKIFYRPEALAGRQSDAYKSLQFSLTNGKIRVVNPTGFYLSISRARFVNGKQTVPLANTVMLAPFSSTEWSVSGSIVSLRGGKILITQANDYGAYVENERNL